MSVVTKRIYKLQMMKIDLMLETIQAILDSITSRIDILPKDLIEEIEVIATKFIRTHDRIDRAREKNINNFYNKLRRHYDSVFELEVDDGKEES